MGGAFQAMKRAADQLKEDNEASAEGGVVAVSNGFRPWHGDPRDIEGPRESSDCSAKADLKCITAATAGMPGRVERFEAMAAEAHRLQERLEAKVETDVGGIERFQNGFRVRIKLPIDGVAKNINSPRRSSEHRANRDLEMITAAGCDAPDHAEHFDAIAKEEHMA